jgi:FKBP-type peptidyl-prolyl cis-trans isomerase
MRIRHLVLPLAICAAAAACENPAIDEDQDPCEPPQATLSQRGDTVVSSTSLRYLETVVGTGSVATFCRGAAVRYVGRLQTGAVFDSVPADTTFRFVVGDPRLIPGFNEGVLGMKVGGQRRVIIPASLGYGGETRPARPNLGFSGIPANATLVFDIKLTEVQQ